MAYCGRTHLEDDCPICFPRTDKIMEEPASAYVNLWELITTVSSKNRDLPNQERCEKIREICGRHSGFGTELSLEINKFGVWTIKIFHHESTDRPHEITLTIHPSGSISVSRVSHRDGVTEDRCLSF